MERSLPSTRPALPQQGQKCMTYRSTTSNRKRQTHLSTLIQEQFEGGSSSGRLFILRSPRLNRSYGASRQELSSQSITSPVTAFTRHLTDWIARIPIWPDSHLSAATAFQRFYFCALFLS